MRIRSRSRSDIGMRETNEDSLIRREWTENGRTIALYAVADGVGGLDYGEVAAQIATDEADKWWNDIVPDKVDSSPFRTMGDLMTQIDLAIRDEARARNCKMATTFTAVFIVDDKAYIYHVGDSKVFYKDASGSETGFKSVDHVAETKTGKTALYSCLGNAFKALSQIYVNMIDIKSGDSLYIGSDGVLGFVTPKQIETMKNPEELFLEAAENGSMDNKTLIQVEVRA